MGEAIIQEKVANCLTFMAAAGMVSACEQKNNTKQQLNGSVVCEAWQ